MFFSDLEGKPSRDPSAFNRYCRSIAQAVAKSPLLL
ncbi:MAG: hypothetical protein QOF83_3613 [Solirubrobacteraceae bacterium]|jgi:phytoene/squalene synthetase|nr:hypothetical protein [Solirubrobacteraceae bacterium]